MLRVKEMVGMSECLPFGSDLGQDDPTSLFRSDTGMVTEGAFREQANTAAPLPPGGWQEDGGGALLSAEHECGDGGWLPSAQ